MARVFYSVSGEGRGHATRTAAVVEQLRQRHQVTLFAYGDAYHWLTPQYHGTEVRVRAVNGMRLRYSGNRVNYLSTGLRGARFAARNLPSLVDHLAERIRREEPQLVITDFEPALPRAARRCGVPFVSLDHQHFLVVNDLSALPFHLRWYGDFLGLAVRAYYGGQARTIVSSFYSPPLKPCYQESSVQVGVLLRSEVLSAKPERLGHLAAYLRRGVSGGLLEVLAACGVPVRVYGLGVHPQRGGATFHEVSAGQFLEDLASSEALVCTAGNQLVGEALYLGKPVLALPEAGNFEQQINAHFVRESGMGDWAPMRSMTPYPLKAFLDNLGQYRSAINPASVAGNARAFEALRPYLD